MKHLDDAAHASDETRGWLSRHTTLGETARTLFDEPANLREAWARTTASAVVLLTALQITTGVLLAFYYVPSDASAQTTVAFIEKVLPAGSWLRALHSQGSWWLVVALLAHLAQRLFVGAGWRRRPVGWTACVLLLALSLAGSATGYSLPWDARAFFSTRVAASIAGQLPLFGNQARAWLLGGHDLSTLTVSRFYALHVFLIPGLILSVVLARLFIFREGAAQQDATLTSNSSTRDASHASTVEASFASAVDTSDAPTQTPRAHSTGARHAQSTGGWRAQLARQFVTAGVVFLALALYASKYPAPLAPPPEAAPAGYLPRPGAQFLWLFQLLKYLPGPLASLTALLVPLIFFGGLASLPFLQATRFARLASHPRRNLGVALFLSGIALVALLTAAAYVEDARNPRVRERLAAQSEQEAAFRREPFKPLRLNPQAELSPASPATGELSASSAEAGTPEEVSAAPPEAYTRHCAKCHGARGEGKSINPRLVGITAQPRRTLEDIIAIINNPRAYDLEQRMPSFARKLSDEEKRAIAEWIVSLK